MHPFTLAVVAFTWAVALVAGALVVPVYSSQTAPARASLTLVQENGLRVLLPVAVPALVAALVSLALHHRCSRGGRASGVVAWSLTGALFALCLVAIASIGVFMVPVPALLAAAAASTPSGPGRAGSLSIPSPP